MANTIARARPFSDICLYARCRLLLRSALALGVRLSGGGDPAGKLRCGVQQWMRHLEDLRREFQLREDELELLHMIDQRLLKPEEPPDAAFFTTVLTEVERILGSFRTRILLKRGTSLVHAYSTIADEIGAVVENSMSVNGRCITENLTIIEQDLNPGLPERHPDGRPVRHSVLATPIRFQNKPVGALCIESSAVAAYTESHKDALVKVAAQVSLALERAQSVASAEAIKDLERLTFSDDDSELVIQKAFERVVQELHRQQLPVSGVQILFLSNKSHDELEIVYSTHDSDVGIQVPVNHSISGRALRERRTVVVADVGADPNYVRLLGSEIQSEIAVPLFVGGNTVPIGVLNVESTERDIFGGYNEVAITNFANQMRNLLAMTKLRADVTSALELRATNELLAAVGDQATHMVHRLNNTVGAMRFRIMDLKDSVESGQLDMEYLTESLDTLLQGTERALEMPRRVTQMLGTAELKVSINDCIRNALSDVAVPERVAVDVRLSDEVTQLAPANFDIVVQNLVQNAIDAMPDGGTLTITTQVERHPSLGITGVTMSVADTGIGIPPEVEPRVFELAYTTKSKRGTGIGLWWVRNFVRRAGGDVNFETVVGQGTEFVVRLPVAAAERGD